MSIKKSYLIFIIIIAFSNLSADDNYIEQAKYYLKEKFMPDSAISILEKSILSKTRVNYEEIYWLARSYQYNDDFKKAIYFYSIYLNHDSTSTKAMSSANNLAISICLSDSNCNDPIKKLWYYKVKLEKAFMYINSDSAAKAYLLIKEAEILQPNLASGYIYEIYLFMRNDKPVNCIYTADSARVYCDSTNLIYFNDSYKLLEHHITLMMKLKLSKILLMNQEYDKAEIEIKSTKEFLKNKFIIKRTDVSKISENIDIKKRQEFLSLIDRIIFDNVQRLEIYNERINLLSVVMKNGKTDVSEYKRKISSFLESKYLIVRNDANELLNNHIDWQK